MTCFALHCLFFFLQTYTLIQAYENCQCGYECVSNRRSIESGSTREDESNIFFGLSPKRRSKRTVLESQIECDLGKSCFACEEGMYGGGGSNLCSLCPTGHYCPDPGMCLALPCLSGTYSGSTGALHCDCCPNAGFVPNPEADGCVQCEHGKIAQTCDSQCVVCEEGMVPNALRSQCLCCPTGSWCSGGFENFCDSERYSASCSSSENDCKCCDPGKRVKNDRSGCNICPAGSISGTCSSACTLCGEGWYAEIDECKKCPCASYCSGGVRNLCPAERWSPLKSKTLSDCRCCNAGQKHANGGCSCEQCEPGSISSSCSVTCQQCSAGYYANAGADGCFDCPCGSFCPDGTGLKSTCPQSYHISPPRSEEASACQCCAPGLFPAPDRCSCNTCPVGSISPRCASECEICAPGKFATSDRRQCLDCPIGAFCQNGVKVLCPEGHTTAGLASQYSDQCICCDAGTYSSTSRECLVCPEGRVSPDDCSSQCIVCVDGTFQVDGITCLTCPEGFYCANGLKHECPEETYSLRGSSSISDCQCCSVNFEVNPQRSGCIACPSTQISTGHCDACSCCPAGYVIDIVKKTCDACGPGQISHECDLACQCCSPGFFASDGGTSCAACPPGSIQPDGCKESCIECNIHGSYADSARTKCLECPMGNYCSEGLRYECPAGTFSLGGSSRVEDCRCCPGSPTDGPDGSRGGCVNCFASGMRSSEEVCQECLCCDPGFIPSSSASTECVQCAPERVAYCPSRSSSCECCRPGSIPDGEQGACDTCPDGEVQPAECQTHCVPCQPGFYQSPDHTTCLPCPSGMISFTQRSTQCTVCTGTKTPNTDSTECIPCAEGYECENGIMSDCRRGHYCSAGLPIPCMPGTGFLRGVNIGPVCPECPMGYYCPGSDIIECGPSTYCPPGSIGVSDCGCSGHGDCHDGLHPPEKCYCWVGYSLEDCSDYACFDVDYRSRKVCSSSGICVAFDECNCFEGFEEIDCASWTCFGISKNSNLVCSGHGRCTKVDRCICSKHFVGKNCSSDNNQEKNSLAQKRQKIASIVIPFSAVSFVLICVIFISFLVIYLSCRTQKKELNRYENIEDIDVLVKENELQNVEFSNSEIAKLKINTDLWNLNFEDIQVICRLGSGASGNVFKAKWLRNLLVAFKVFHIRANVDIDKFKEFETEVEILASCHHLHILQFFGAVFKLPRVGVVTKFAENGNLKQFILAYKKKHSQQSYPVKERIRLLREIASAMSYLHDKKIAHRDLKPQNVVISKTEEAKVMDFACAKTIDAGQENTMLVGSSMFRAPEVITMSISENGGKIGEYTEKVDCFSFAILAWMVLTENFRPYSGGKIQTRDIDNQVANGLRPSINDLVEYPGYLIDVIEGMWRKDAEKRFSMKKAHDEIAQKSMRAEEVEFVKKVEEEEELRKKSKPSSFVKMKRQTLSFLKRSRREQLKKKQGGYSRLQEE